MRYGIGVGREGFTWSGEQAVARKAEWPDWRPPADMLSRQPYLPRFMAGGPGNPLGARAMYLGETEYRIHGTNKPDTIGKRVSSGCIRLTNEDVADLYERVKIGAKVIVLPAMLRNPAARRPLQGAPARRRRLPLAGPGIAVEPAFDIGAERAMSHRLEPKRTCRHLRSDCGCKSSLLCASFRLDPDAIAMLPDRRRRSSRPLSHRGQTTSYRREKAGAWPQEVSGIFPSASQPSMEVQLLAGHSDLRMNVGDHVLENGEVVTFPFMDSPQTFPLSSSVHQDQDFTWRATRLVRW